MQMIDVLRAKLNEEHKPGVTFAHALAADLIRRARNGDNEAAALILIASTMPTPKPAPDDPAALFRVIVDRIRPEVLGAIGDGWSVEAIKAAFAQTYSQRDPGIINQAIDVVVDESGRK